MPTPASGSPLPGPTGATGLLLNIGHGSSGWAKACESARIDAYFVCGRQPEIDIEGLMPACYTGAEAA